MGHKAQRDDMWTCPVFPDLSRKQQAQFERFSEYLEGAGHVLDHTVTAVFYAKAGDDTELTSVFQQCVAARFSPLVTAFARHVLVRGAYAALDDQPEPSVMTVQGHGVTLTARRSDTVSAFELACIHKDNVLTFVCTENNPCSLSVQTYRGAYAELDHLVNRSAKLFANVAQGYGCLRPVLAPPIAV